MRSLGLVLALAGVSSLAAPAIADDHSAGTTYRVYFLGGQSNMDGYGHNDDLPAELQAPRDDIRIFTGEDVEDGSEGGGEGLWASLDPGHGTNFTTDGAQNTLSDRFGPELTFGTTMAELRPDERIAIIKFSRGGTSLVHGVSGYGSWDPDYNEKNRRNLYDQTLTAIRTAMTTRDIDGDGATDTLAPAGIVWMQGEADAFDDWAASREYDLNLARLMSLLRAALHEDDLPVVIGRIKDSGDTAETRVMKYSPEVRAAQARFAANDVCAEMVTASDDFSFFDGWHYLSRDYIALGEAFAKSMHDLERSC